MSRPPASLRALAVARGDEPADLLITGGRVLSPITREWVATDLAIADGFVAGWGKRDAKETVDVGGAALVAGFVDAHMHLESTKLWVDEFVRGALPCGTTAVACDPHEIANVAGLEGVWVQLQKLPKRCLSHLDSPLQVAYRPQVLKVLELPFRRPIFDT